MTDREKLGVILSVVLSELKTASQRESAAKLGFGVLDRVLQNVALALDGQKMGHLLAQSLSEAAMAAIRPLLRED
jgi:hypothetical protein